MKRYHERKTLRFDGELVSNMEEDTNGDWVKHEDHILTTENLLHAVETLLGETEDSDYLTQSERVTMARSAIREAHHRETL